MSYASFSLKNFNSNYDNDYDHFAVASLPWKHRKNGIYARSLRHSYGTSMAFLQRLKILQARCGCIRM